jgi:tetratricopeptide (TPR) repeat protein
MKKMTGLTFVLLTALLLATAGTGCSAKAKMAYHLKKANQAFDAGDYDKAEIEYINVLRKDHENAQAIGRLGTLYFNQGRLLKAAPFLLKGCEVDTNNLDLHLKLGSFYLMAGKQKAARDQADFILNRSPQDNKASLLLVAAVDSPKTLAETKLRLETLLQKGDGAGLEVALAGIALRSGDLKKAEACLNRAETLDPRLSATWSVKAGIYLAQTNLVQAESALKKAAELAPDRSAEKVQYAEFKVQNGDPAGGQHLLEEMVRKTPDYFPAWMSLVSMAATEKKYDECARLLAKVLVRDPDDFNALMSSGQLKLSQGKTAEAAVIFERMSKMFAQAPGVHYQMAVTYLAETNVDKALTSLNRAISLNTNYTEAILLLDQLEIQRGNAELVIPSLKKLVQKYPQAAPVQLLLADAFRTQGNFDDALVIYRQFQTLSPTNAQIPLMMGAVFFQQNKMADARKAFARALELAPDNFTALEQLVNLDMMDQQYAVASQRVQLQLAKNPGLAALQILQAQIFMAQGDSKQAEAVLSKLAAVQPDNETAYMLLARMYLESKQAQKALAELKIATDKNPKNETALLISAMTYNDEKDYKAARDAYEKLLLVNPKSTAALNNLAYIYSEYLGDLGRAYLLAQQAKDLNPNDPSSSDTLGWILCKRGQYLLAIGLLQVSANQLPNEPEVQFHLGWAQYMMGQESAARQTLEHALQLGKTFRGQEECRACLAVFKVDPKNAGADDVAQLEKRVAAQPADSIAMLRLADIYKREGVVDKALTMYEATLKANPNSVPSLINLAQLYAAKKNPQKALEMAKLAYRLASDNSQASLILGRLAYETGDYKLSVNLLQALAFNQATNPEALFDYGRSAYAMGQVEEAQTAMRGALQLGGTFAHADEAQRFLSLTALATDVSKAQASVTQIEAILKSEPDYVPALMVMAGLQNTKSDGKTAMLTYEKIINKYPNFSPAYKELAILCSKNTKSDPQAIDFATKARAAYPDDLAVAKALGIILYQKGDYSKAERVLKDCIAGSPTDVAPLYYYLGMTQYQLKKSLDCKKNLQQALNLNLPDQFAQEAKKILEELK